jgi:hypothetical protein
MRGITAARAVLWTSCASSLALFLLYVAGILDTAMGWVRSLDSQKVADLTKEIPVWWSVLSGLMTGIGAFFARHYNTIDKRLNGTWYWVAYASDAGHKIVDLGKGVVTITNLNKINPGLVGEIIVGRTEKNLTSFALENKIFRSTQVLIGKRVGPAAYYEWTYDDLNISGMSRLEYSPSYPPSYLPASKWWQRPLPRRRKMDVRGSFMFDNGQATGKIEYYLTDDEANLKYQHLAYQATASQEVPSPEHQSTLNPLASVLSPASPESRRLRPWPGRS